MSVAASLFIVAVAFILDLLIFLYLWRRIPVEPAISIPRELWQRISRLAHTERREPQAQAVCILESYFSNEDTHK